MAIEATNNSSATPIYTTAAGAAIGGAGSFFGTKAVFDSKLKKTMESADSFSKSKKAPQVVAALASEAKDKLKAAQDEFAAQAKAVATEFFEVDSSYKSTPQEMLSLFNEESDEFRALTNLFETDWDGSLPPPKMFLEAVKETAKLDTTKLVTENGYANLAQLQEAAAQTPAQKLLTQINDIRSSELSKAGFPNQRLRFDDFVSYLHVDAPYRLRTLGISGYDDIGALRQAAENGDEEATKFLNSLVEYYKRGTTYLQDFDEKTFEKLVFGEYEALKKQIADTTNELLRSSNYDSLGALKNAAEATRPQQLLETVNFVDKTRKVLPVLEKAKSAAEAIAGTADKPGLKATSEALEEASKKTDAAGIKSSMEGVWGNIKDSVESAYKTLNKKTVRNAGILGALGLGIAGYIAAKSIKSDK